MSDADDDDFHALLAQALAENASREAAATRPPAPTLRVRNVSTRGVVSIGSQYAGRFVEVEPRANGVFLRFVVFRPASEPAAGAPRDDDGGTE
jgi:hypothetical protein